MTPVPLDLPVRPNEAAALARVVLETAGHKPLTDDIRNRIAARSGALRLQSIRPWFGSLARDPIHKSAVYLAADGVGPVLLHFAPASAPTSGVFPKALLIGRASDLVMNAIPFGPGDRASLDAFSTRIDAAFQPRPQGSRSAIVAPPSAEVFEAFRSILKRTGKNVAATEGSYHLTLWCAIRAGWREGWSAGVELDPADGLPTVDECPRYTRFTLATTDFAAAARTRIRIAEVRSAAKVARPFDFELSLEGAPCPTTPGDIAAALESVRAELIAPRIAPGSDVAALAAAALRGRSMLSLRAPCPPAAVRSTYKVTSHTEDLDGIAALLA